MVACIHKNSRGREGHGGRMLLGLYYHKPTQVERRAVSEIVCPEAYIVLEWEVLEVKGSVTKAIATGWCSWSGCNPTTVRLAESRQ